MNNDYPSRSVDVLYGIDNITDAIEKFINETKTKYDVCADSTIPSFIVKKGIIGKFLDFKNNRNGQIRYITDVTGQNIGYCKQIMEAVQLRHLEGPKGVFRINETECHYNVVLDEPRQMAIMIRSNMHEIVSQYQKVFNMLWEKATPVKERIREIEAFEEGIGKAVSSRDEEKHPPSNRAVTSQPILEPSSDPNTNN
jgi:two-component system, OmpR family, sensor histidine kinase VicK